MTQEELMERLAVHARDIGEHTSRSLLLMDQVEGALVDTLEAQKAGAHYFRAKSPHDARGFDRAAFRTEAVLEILRTIRSSLVEKSQHDLDCAYGLTADA